MWPTSTRFRETVTGSHRALARIRVLSTTQFGAAPTGGTELPILSGDVKLSATADVKATLDLTVPGDYWDLVQPYGAELFVERGVAFGDGTQEYVPLGYYRVEKIDQDRAPHGPIQVTGADRTAQLQQNRVIYPYQIPSGSTHRHIFERLVNGRDTTAAAVSSAAYGMFLGTAVPIIFTGYDPDTATVVAGLTAEDSAYEFLAKLVDARQCVLRFLPTGELSVESTVRGPDVAPGYTIKGGSTGTLVSASRSVSRAGVYNVVRATGSDPAIQTGYRLAYNNDELSPLYWKGRFGVAPRYYASPLLRTSDAADKAAETILGRYTGLPTEVGLFTVPDPALQPLDVITAQVGGAVAVHVIDEVTVPLVGDAAVVVRTRTVNDVGVIETDPEAPPPPPPPDPDLPPDPVPVPGGGDGVQAAVQFGWGSVIDGDEFAYTGTPNPAKWGLYDGAGHVGNGLRRPSAFAVHDGIMTITGDSGGTTGGTAFRRGEMGYRVEARMRCYNTAPGNDRYHPVLILWPDSDQWPAGAEYDFAEADEGTGVMNAFMHLPNHEPYRQDHVERDLDIQNWHNYACEWNPSARTLKAWIDGTVFYTGSGRVADAPGPMHLTVQLDHFGGNPRPANMDVAWVRIYQRPNP